MRELLRSIARASMLRRGVSRINRPTFVNGKKAPSYFAQNWRKEAAFALNAEYREDVLKNVERRRLLRRRKGRRVA